MSFMRGEYYVWHDDDDIHLPSTMPNELFDELVVMRFAELSKDEVKKAEKRAIENHSGNFGCDEVRKKHGLETALERIKKRCIKKE